MVIHFGDRVCEKVTQESLDWHFSAVGQNWRWRSKSEM